ncbi:MAG: DUF4105 domain-containing protein [Bacteroidales bacterium]
MNKIVIKLSFILLFSILIYNSTHLNANDRAEVSLLTCEAGSELYSTFGHSALRVYYPQQDKDIVFNFGLFDFSTPYFYTKFIRGKLKYMLGIQYMEDFMHQFEWEGRSVKEQRLNLTDEQTAELIERLSFLYLPQNRYYFYSFLHKNCTSELRDLIFPLIENATSEFKEDSAAITYRELLNGYIEGWAKFGINLILGSSLDKTINSYESMFLPENLYMGVALVQNGESPLANKGIYLYKSEKSGRDSTLWKLLVSPFFIFSLLFAGMLFLAIKQYRRGMSKTFSILNNVFLLLVSLLGVVITVIILITEHTELYNNYNLLWCNPLFLSVVFFSLKGWKKTERLLSAISLVFLAILQVVWACNIQYVEPAFAPIVATLALLFIVRVQK